MSDRVANRTLMAQLERHYINPTDPMPGGVFVPECGLNGVQSGQRADALYVGFTSASGRILVGHEVKVSRSDWLRELAKPAKADTWADACHAWYIVAPPGVVKLDELPDGWGLLEPSPKLRTKLKVVVKARVRRDVVPPWDAVRSILARRDTIDRELRREFVNVTTETIRTELEERADRQAAARRLTPEESNKLAAVAQLEEITGLELASWAYENGQVSPDELAAALAVVRGARKLPRAEHLARQSQELAKAAKGLEAVVEEWRKVGGR